MIALYVVIGVESLVCVVFAALVVKALVDLKKASETVEIPDEGETQDAAAFPLSGYSAERITHAQAYAALTQEQKALYDALKAYALTKANTRLAASKHNETVKQGGKLIVELKVKRKTPVALFPFVNNLLKEYHKNLAGGAGSVRVKKTEIFLLDEADLTAAKSMIDIMYEQLENEKQSAKERRRKKKNAPAERAEAAASAMTGATGVGASDALVQLREASADTAVARGANEIADGEAAAASQDADARKA